MPVVQPLEAVAITSGVSTVVEIFGQIWSLMTGNPLIMVFIGASLLGVGVGVFRKLRSAVGKH